MSARDDEAARIIHQVDQAMAAVSQMAGLVWSYYNKLMEKGFTEEKAWELTVAMQAGMMPKSPPLHNSEDMV